MSERFQDDDIEFDFFEDVDTHEQSPPDWLDDEQEASTRGASAAAASGRLGRRRRRRRSQPAREAHRARRRRRRPRDPPRVPHPQLHGRGQGGHVQGLHGGHGRRRERLGQDRPRPGCRVDDPRRQAQPARDDPRRPGRSPAAGAERGGGDQGAGRPRQRAGRRAPVALVPDHRHEKARGRVPCHCGLRRRLRRVAAARRAGEPARDERRHLGRSLPHRVARADARRRRVGRSGARVGFRPEPRVREPRLLGARVRARERRGHGRRHDDRWPARDRDRRDEGAAERHRPLHRHRQHRHRRHRSRVRGDDRGHRRRTRKCRSRSR